MDFYSLDRTRFPIVVLSASEPRSPTDAELESMFVRGALLLDGGEPYLLVYVPPGLLGARQRRRYAVWLNENRARLERLNRGTALVVPNPILRALARAVLRLAPPPTEVHFCATIAEAFAWCEARLGATASFAPHGAMG